jgi:cyclase
MKIRIIPTILTDGLTVVKGEKFDNWRTVGSAEAIAGLYGNRNVDELMFLDVNARLKNSFINPELLAKFSNTLDVPFSVGGGINSLDHARLLFKSGAEKIVLGTAALLHPELITQIAQVYGSQATVVSMDLGSSPGKVYSHSGKIEHEVDPIQLAIKFQEFLIFTSVRFKPIFAC